MAEREGRGERGDCGEMGAEREREEEKVGVMEWRIFLRGREERDEVKSHSFRRSLVLSSLNCRRV